MSFWSKQSHCQPLFHSKARLLSLLQPCILSVAIKNFKLKSVLFFNLNPLFFSFQYWYDLKEYKIYRGQNTIYVPTPIETVRPHVENGAVLPLGISLLVND